MLRRIKYWLLRLLLDDICQCSHCHECMLSHEITIGCGDHTISGPACGENEVFMQARKAWKLEK